MDVTPSSLRWSNPSQDIAWDDLVEAAAEGDQAAFGQLVEATYLGVFTLAYRMVGDREDARDVVQEAYIKAHKGLSRFRGDAHFTTWLYRITSNCAASFRTKRSKHRHDQLESDPDVVDERPSSDPQQRAASRELRDELIAVLRELPPKLRAVVVLRDVYDLPHAEIATELGISESAAKVRLHRARKQLRDLLYAAREPAEDVAVEVTDAV